MGVYMCAWLLVYMYALMCASLCMWVGGSGVFIIVKHIWNKIYGASEKTTKTKLTSWVTDYYFCGEDGHYD